MSSALSAQQAYKVNVPSGGNCCCGQYTELFFPNLDFEEPPLPPPGGLILYSAGDFFGGWTCTRATIDYKDAFFGNLTLGNPNGRSNFIDLHGSPGFGAIEYNLTGLTPGNMYRIEFWTAQNGTGYTSTGTLKIAGGAWLTGNWTVSVDGSVFWFKVTFEFMALAPTAKMEFSSIGGSEWGGTLLDDIHIFECPGDQEAPIVNNPPDDVEIECDKDIPKVPVLNVNDNCDLSPDFTFKEILELIDPCTKKITRKWDIRDDCGNLTQEEQIITIADKTPPEIKKAPVDARVSCNSDVQKQFADWIKNNGNATAFDECGKISWRNTYDHLPQKVCDTILVEFIAQDHCGQETSVFGNFIVFDTSAPKIIKVAEDRNLNCNGAWQDSLKFWLYFHAYAEAKDECDTVLWTNNFKGDSTKSPLDVTFYAKDRCGNIDSTKAQFINRKSSDTSIVNLTSCTISKNTSDTLNFQIAGCDSIVIINTRKVYSDTSRFFFNTCDSLQKQSDSLFYINVEGCDSIVINTYEIHPIQITQLKDFSCTYNKLSFDTLVLQGSYCDSIIITEHQPLRKDSIFLVNTSCDSTQRGTKVINFKNQFGCDSIVTTQTLFSPQTISHIQSFECGLANSFTDTLIITTSLCDSLIITEHLSLMEDSLFIQSHTCDPSKAGKLISKFKNRFGCDSTVVENVILDPSQNRIISAYSCYPSDTGISIQIFKNQYGCDSIIQTQTGLLRSDSILIQKFTCKINEVGVNISTLTNRDGCDSIITTKIDLVKSDTTYQFKKTCDINQQKIDTFRTNGTYCDSLIIIETKFVASDTSYQTQTSCLFTKSGLDSVKFINSKGCDSLVYIQTNYTPLKLQISIDSISCFNSNDGQVRIMNTFDFGKPYTLWINNLAVGEQSVVTNLKPGNYQISVKDSLGCVTDTLQFDLNNPQELITDLGNDLEVNANTEFNLKLNYNRKPQIIQWIPNQLTSCTNCEEIKWFTDRDVWVYTLSTDERNCKSLDSIFIRVRKESKVYVPNSFTPNGDNINDYFYVIGSDDMQIKLLQIYSRWGELLFSTENALANHAETGWNGSFNNQKMNPGVYVYYAKILLNNGEILDLKGDLSLIR